MAGKDMHVAVEAHEKKSIILEIYHRERAFLPWSFVFLPRSGFLQVSSLVCDVICISGSQPRLTHHIKTSLHVQDTPI